MKKLIIFDLDGTLNISKMPLDREMAIVFCKLLAKIKIAVISGASFAQFKKQFLGSLNCDSENFSKLFILPTNGSSLYKYEQGKWKVVYAELFNLEEKEKIYKALKLAVPDINKEFIEDRGSQITYSALGQKAPIELKKKWDPNHKKRGKIRRLLLLDLQEFEINIGGETSIDITKKGVDKAYGVQKIGDNLNISEKDMLFIGDAVFPGGNDYPVKKAGIETIQVSGPEETKKIICKLLK